VHSRARVLASELQFQTNCRFFCSRVCPKSVFVHAMYLSCIWKWIRSREQDSAPESRRVSLYSVKVIKIWRLTINRFLVLWAPHRSLRCFETDRETDCTALLFLETQSIERGQLLCAQNPENCAYPFTWCLKLFCLCRTESMRIDLIWSIPQIGRLKSSHT